MICLNGRVRDGAGLIASGRGPIKREERVGSRVPDRPSLLQGRCRCGTVTFAMFCYPRLDACGNEVSHSGMGEAMVLR